MKRVLVIEDDDISRRFMTDALSLLPLEWQSCTGFAEAHCLLGRQHFDLVVSDINTVDGSLLEHAALLPENCRKLAVSADMTPALAARLRQLGIDDVLAKPMGVGALHQAVNLLLETAGGESGMQPYWNHLQAMAALGQDERILASLKDMFRAELPLMMERIDSAYRAGAFGEIHATLHKLKASCGFLGAERLLQECYRLDGHIDQPNLARFSEAARATLALI
jgi:CheY-like chemotaxis protein